MEIGFWSGCLGYLMPKDVEEKNSNLREEVREGHWTALLAEGSFCMCAVPARRVASHLGSSGEHQGAAVELTTLCGTSAPCTCWLQGGGTGVRTREDDQAVTLSSSVRRARNASFLRSG